jgi:hypothetical protein
MKLGSAIQLTAAILSPDLPVLWTGPSGIGKSDAAVAIAKARGERMLCYYPVTKAPEDTAIPRVYEGSPGEWLARFFPVGLMADICRKDCPPTLLLVDDVGEVRGPMQGVVMHLILARQVGDDKISPNVSMMLCANTREHDIYANTLSAPLIGRAHMVKIEHDYEAFAAWCIAHRDDGGGIDPIVASYALWQRDCFASVMPDDGSQYCSPRNLARAGRTIARVKRAGMTVSPEIVAGDVGASVGGDLALYHDTVGDLVPFEDVLRNPAFIKQMTDPGLVYAYLTQAAIRAQTDPDTVRRWGARLHGELGEILALLAGW